MKANIICGAILLVIVGIFWSQRDYEDPLVGIFPDMVLIVLAVLGAAILAHGILRGDRTSTLGVRELNWRRLSAAIALVVGWSLALGMVGFTISGIIAFMIMALMVREGRPTLRNVIQDFVVALVVVIGCFFIFTRVLVVPLPVSTLIGM